MVNQKKLVSKLGRQDWVNAGLTVLAESGVEAVRVEPLAKLMNVTKGSFYWHFKDRNDLLAAILEAWVQLSTSSVIDQINQINADPKTKLLKLFEIAVEVSEQDIPAMGRVENAIRAWASIDSQVTAVLARIDQQRLDYTKDLFLQLGFNSQEALVRARMAYYTMVVGEQTVGVRSNQAERLAEMRLQYAILTSPPTSAALD
jgi:AcrR family transcriptional regulator